MCLRGIPLSLAGKRGADSRSRRSVPHRITTAASDELSLEDNHTRGTAACIRCLACLTRRQNVFEILPSAIAFQTDSVVDKCVNCIAKNFYFMKADQDYNFLPPAIFKQLLLVRTN